MPGYALHVKNSLPMLRKSKILHLVAWPKTPTGACLWTLLGDLCPPNPLKSGPLQPQKPSYAPADWIVVSFGTDDLLVNYKLNMS